MPSSDNINLPELAQAVEQERTASFEGGELSHKEALHRVLEKKHEMPAPRPAEGAPAPSPAISAGQTEGMLPNYASEESEQARAKVRELIDMTFDKGLAAGIRAAKAEDPAVMDMYHDALVDKLLETLKEKKLL